MQSNAALSVPERGRSRGLLALLPAAALLTLLRVPAFFEPHFYTDEAGYATTARAVLHGGVLYTSAWTNKPPLQVWTVATVAWVPGVPIWLLRGLTLAAALVALVAVAWLARRHLSPGRQVAATCVAAVFLGLPVLDAELIVPDSLLIAPMSWAGVLVLDAVVRRGARVGRWRLVLAGALAGAALGYQQTALADTIALASLLAVTQPRPAAAAGRFLAGAGAVVTAWLVPVLVTAGPAAVGFSLAGFYIQYTGFALGATGTSPLAHAAGLAAVLGLLVAGGLLVRSRLTLLPAAAVWTGAALFAPAATHQPYPHLLTPAVVPGALLVASVRLPALRAASWRAALRTAPLAIGLAADLALASGAGLDWAPSVSNSFINSQRSLTQYYAGFISSVGDQRSLQQWRGGFDTRVQADADVAAWLRAHGMRGARTVVWSSDAWLYVLADLPVLLPTAPIYNDAVLTGAQGRLASEVADLDPDIIVTANDALAGLPEIVPLLDQQYRHVFTSDPDTVWVRVGSWADIDS